MACNQDGTERLPLLVIGKYAKPRCFKYINMNLLPVTHESQMKARMGSALFEKWVHQIDRQMRVTNRHILLFIDHWSSHVCVAGLTNVKLIFFPRSCTSKLQPVDQGIIQNVKVCYRKTMIRRNVQCLDENKPVEAINLKDAVFITGNTWDNVSITTMSNCWNKAGYPDEVAEPSDDPFESDEEEETNESGGGLWGSITHHCPFLAEISSSDFVSLDNNVVTECQPTDKEATREALGAVQSMDSANHEREEEADDLDDDISVLEPEPLRSIEATEAARTLRMLL